MNFSLINLCLSYRENILPFTYSSLAADSNWAYNKKKRKKKDFSLSTYDLLLLLSIKYRISFLPAILGYKLINPVEKEVIEYIRKLAGLTIVVLQRLFLLGDQTEIPNLSKYDPVVIKLGLVTVAQMILRIWKNTPPPEVTKWVELMLEVVSYEHMLARINDEVDNFKRSLDCFLICDTV